MLQPETLVLPPTLQDQRAFLSDKFFTSLVSDVEHGAVVNNIAEEAGSHDVLAIVTLGMARWQKMVPGQVEPVRPDLAV